MFRDRAEAGALLARRLGGYAGREGLIVLALPRGGVITAYEIAVRLGAALDVMIVRKIGFPGEPELAIGAVAETGVAVYNNSIISAYGVPESYIKEETIRQKDEIARRIKLYRKGQRLTPLCGRIVIIADDGVATGATAKAAAFAVKEEKPSRLILALPVSPPETAKELMQHVDELVCLHTPEDFIAVGSYYGDFRQVTDKEVIETIEKSVTLRNMHPSPRHPSPS